MSENHSGIAVFWFRRDIRLSDNHGLKKAAEFGLPVLPLFIFDKEILEDLEDKDDARVIFIYDELNRISDELARLGGKFRVEIGDPVTVYQKLLEELPIRKIFTNLDYEPYARKRDGKIKEMIEAKAGSFEVFKDQVIFERNEVLKDDGKPYTVYTPYSRKWLKSFESEGISEYEIDLKKVDWASEFGNEMPSLNDIGFERSSIPIPERTVIEEIIDTYDKTRNFPALKNGTSRLGVHLRFGTISIRKLVKFAAEHNRTYLNELIWREFYMMILYHYPHVVSKSFREKYDQIPWRKDEESFERWKEGKTGYPIVDAGMRELQNTGYMHNRVRMIVASFLVKHLLIDWRWGEAWFARHLLDFELASNNGGWQWAAGSGCDAAPYFRIFNPISQQQKFDPEFKYIKKWVPEFGTDAYPEPIVEHKFARERALNTFKEVL